MTIYPQYFTEYPRLGPSIPLVIDIHRVDRSYPAHRHDFLEFSLVISGRGSETINGNVHPMEPGTLTLVLPYQFHELQAEPGEPLMLYNCMFSAELLTGDHEYASGFKELLLSEGDDRPAYVQLPASSAEPLARFLQEMLVEFESGNSWRTALLKAKLTEAMIRIDRLRTEFHASRTDAVTKERTELPAPIWRVIRHMHIHYRDPLTLSGLAEAFHFNETYLSEQIKRHAGKNFVSLLHDIRLRQACSLLSSTEMKISDIAYEVGYGSAKTLFKAFRKYKGVTPGEYRRNGA